MTMHSKIEMPTKHRVIPQGEGEAGELVAIRTLLRAGRFAEATQRLDWWLDRYLPNWRAGDV